MNDKMKVAAITDKEKVEILEVRKPIQMKEKYWLKLKLMQYVLGNKGHS